MSIFSVNEKDAVFCRRGCMLVMWLQGIFGLLLTIKCLIPAAYGVLAIYLPLLLFLQRFGWKQRPLRIAVRVMTAAVWPLAALFLFMLVLNLITGQTMSALSLGYTMSGLCLPILTVMMPGLTAVALRGGRYDKAVACFAQVWLLATGIMAVCTPICDSFPWVWNRSVVLYLFLGLVLAAALILFFCVFMRRRSEEELTTHII